MSSVKIRLGMGRSGFRHEALIYRDSDEYLAATLSFLREGLEADEPALVAVSRANTALLEDELGRDGEAVRFADMESLGRNPARIIPFWRDFLDEHRGVRVRGIGESLWAGRDVAEVEECERHESLLNLAFASAPGWSLLCPYDATGLDDEVLERASHSHHVVSRRGVTDANFNHEAHVDCFAGELRGRPPGAAGFEFERADLVEVRRRVEESAQAVGIDSLDVAAIVVAASELAANSVAHGGGRGTLRIWTEPKKLLIEVQDGGRIEEPLVGRVRPLTTQEGGAACGWPTSSATSSRSAPAKTARPSACRPPGPDPAGVGSSGRAGVCAAQPGVAVGSTGNDERTTMGILDKLTGRAKQAAGDLAGDSSLQRQGRREEEKGEKKEQLDRAQEKAEDKAAEVADLERKT